MTRLILAFPLVLVLGACASFPDFASRSQAGPATEEMVPIPAALMDALQNDLEIGEIAAAAIAGNLAHETGNFTMLQQVRGPSFGYSQWLGSRKVEFFAFAEENGGRHSFEANYGFMIHEIESQYKPMLERMRNSRDLETATRIFMREFLRPNPEKANFNARVRYASRYLREDFDGSGCRHSSFIVGDRIMPCPEAMDDHAKDENVFQRLSRGFERFLKSASENQDG